MELIKFLPFGCQKVQNNYKTICEEAKINFEDFQDALINSTGKSFDELKPILTDGEVIQQNCLFFDKLRLAYLDEFLLIHFNEETKEIIGILNNNYSCVSDGKNYFYPELI